jgi:Tfp pilus assembly protein PilZ
MDQREAVRVPVQIPARCRSASDVKDIFDGQVEDLSRLGLFLATSHEVAVGHAVIVELELPNEEPFALAAEVVRLDRSARRGLGMRFTERGRRPLANFIMRSHAIV